LSDQCPPDENRWTAGALLGPSQHALSVDGTQPIATRPEDWVPECQCRVYDARTLEEVGRWSLKQRMAAGAHTLWIPGEEAFR
ncbi:MAG: hypothetical protein AAF203_03030, partial [Pseudomonadota bacterium]